MDEQDRLREARIATELEAGQGIYYEDDVFLYKQLLAAREKIAELEKELKEVNRDTSEANAQYRSQREDQGYGY